MGQAKAQYSKNTNAPLKAKWGWSGFDEYSNIEPGKLKGKAQARGLAVFFLDTLKCVESQV
jgi:hypothetical protein